METYIDGWAEQDAISAEAHIRCYISAEAP